MSGPDTVLEDMKKLAAKLRSVISLAEKIQDTLIEMAEKNSDFEASSSLMEAALDHLHDAGTELDQAMEV